LKNKGTEEKHPRLITEYRGPKAILCDRLFCVAKAVITNHTKISSAPKESSDKIKFWLIF
jgi:hypothetical protein